MKVVSHQQVKVIEDDKNRYYHQSSEEVVQPPERIPDPLKATFCPANVKAQAPMASYAKSHPPSCLGKMPSGGITSHIKGMGMQISQWGEYLNEA